MDNYQLQQEKEFDLAILNSVLNNVQHSLENMYEIERSKILKAESYKSIIAALDRVQHEVETVKRTYYKD